MNQQTRESVLSRLTELKLMAARRCAQAAMEGDPIVLDSSDRDIQQARLEGMISAIEWVLREDEYGRQDVQKSDSTFV